MYGELRNYAQSRVSKLPRSSVHEATSLVHEAYLRVIRSRDRFDGEAHFFFATSRAMRDILVEEARKAASLKAGDFRARLTFDQLGADLAVEDRPEEILMVDEAVKKLKALDPVNARVVMLRYFSGLTAVETAKILGVSVATIERKWRYLKAWLRRELS